MIRIEPHVVWQDVPGELVLYDQQGNAYHALDRTGSDIWRLLARGTDTSAAAAELAQRYDAPVERIEEDIVRFVADARGKGLLTDVQPIAP
jgi:hypothetical protein